MINLLIKFFPKFKKWSEKKEKFKIFDFIKLFLFNDMIKGGVFLVVAVIFGTLSNFLNAYEMIRISIWFGWVPICLIVLPYLIYGLVVWPIASLIEKFKNSF